MCNNEQGSAAEAAQPLFVRARCEWHWAGLKVNISHAAYAGLRLFVGLVPRRGILCGNPHDRPLHNDGAHTCLVANAGAVAPPPFPRVTRRVSAAFEHGLWPPRRRSRGRSVATARPPPPMHSPRPSWARTYWIDINVSPHACTHGSEIRDTYMLDPRDHRASGAALVRKPARVTTGRCTLCALPSPWGL